MSSGVETRVTVLMSVYNGEKYLREAVDSILSQTFRDFEFLIIEDGSSDGTAQILESYDDARMRIVCNEENIGLTRSLNKGLKLARGEYIARMDADDISLPERLEKQVKFLDAHPEVGVLGTWAQIIDAEGRVVSDLHFPCEPGMVGWFLIFWNCVNHTSAMFRRRIIEVAGGYDDNLRYAQDYEVWNRVSTGTTIANLPLVLVQSRRSPDSLSGLNSETQKRTSIRTRQRTVSRMLGRDVSEEAVGWLHPEALRSGLHDLPRARATAKLIRALYREYLKTNSLSPAQRDAISQSAAGMISVLAASARERLGWRWLLIYDGALRIHPGLFSRGMLRLVAVAVLRGASQRLRAVRSLFGNE